MMNRYIFKMVTDWMPGQSGQRKLTPVLSDDGDWVKFSDHEKQIAKLKADAIEEMLDHLPLLHDQEGTLVFVDEIKEYMAQLRKEG